jgi:predicted  nucleic acid-binding Zn-ribbon protein
MYNLQEKYMQQSLELMAKQHDTMLIQQENQNLLSARMEQMNEQSRLAEEQLQQAMSMSEKLDQNQVELQNHMEEILSSFSGEQKHWLENLAICSNDLEQKADKIQTNLGQQTDKIQTNLGQQTEMIQNNLSQQTETIQLNLGSATEALLEVSVNAKNSMELLEGNFELFQKKTEESLTGIFGIMDEQIAGIAKSLGQSAVEISEAASTVPRAMRSVIEEMKQAKSC